jgi:hypothetical protein
MVWNQKRIYESVDYDYACTYNTMKRKSLE